MNITIKLVPLDVKSVRGELVPLKVAEEYLNSDLYKEKLVDSKLAFIGITHKDRKLDGKHKGIGADDQVLVNRNTVGYVVRCWIDYQTKWLMAEGKLYDPANFSGAVLDDINYIRGLLAEGTRLPASAILDAFWSATYECKRLTEIDGLDVTKNPAFTGAGIEKTI